MTDQTFKATGSGTCLDDAQMARFARLHGISLAEVADLCRRVGGGRAALEAAVAMLRMAGAAR